MKHIKMNIKRTNSGDHEFIELVKLLNADLAIRDGEDYSFYSQFNKLDKIRHVVLAIESGKPSGCGAIKEFDGNTMEIKRMYVTKNICSPTRNRT